MVGIKPTLRPYNGVCALRPWIMRALRLADSLQPMAGQDPPYGLRVRRVGFMPTITPSPLSRTVIKANCGRDGDCHHRSSITMVGIKPTLRHSQQRIRLTALRPALVTRLMG